MNKDYHEIKPPQWAKLPSFKGSEFNRLIAEIARKLDYQDQEVIRKKDNIVVLKTRALPVYKQAVLAFNSNFGKPNMGEQLENRAIGYAGNDAILATLNECDIFYRTNQLFVSYVGIDWVENDFVIFCNKDPVKLEVKTVQAGTSSFNINKIRLLREMPDAIIALRAVPLEHEIAFEFMGWLELKEVKEKCKFVKRPDRDQSFYACNFNKLHPPIDIHEFLTGLTNGGKDYLKQLASESD